MKFPLNVSHRMMNCAFLVCYVLPGIILEPRISLPQEVESVFLGYPFGKKGWKVCDLETREIFISRDVVFYEGVFPFARIEPTKILGQNSSTRPTMSLLKLDP